LQNLERIYHFDQHFIKEINIIWQFSRRTSLIKFIEKTTSKLRDAIQR